MAQLTDVVQDLEQSAALSVTEPQELVEQAGQRLPQVLVLAVL